ncbi:hypothetical protein CVV38_00285 [Candidatus Peregrinibacteria bacterium HGW-Peregrinibacteria-1]|jgi:hypothetical protein|nr:MAG: hypothetical protein CVV38_00285 [Candidatus Peregrinibacteria bacterium HGW-Peregrinibacteria-1]
MPPQPTENYLRIKVVPRSHKTELIETIHDHNGTTHKIRLKSAPEKGKANQELIKFLSKLLDTPTETITIISGKSDRTKLIKIKQ